MHDDYMQPPFLLATAGHLAQLQRCGSELVACPVLGGLSVSVREIIHLCMRVCFCTGKGHGKVFHCQGHSMRPRLCFLWSSLSLLLCHCSVDITRLLSCG